MSYSLNELQALLRKAVTGAGFPAGHAVAIASAGVWLARRRVPVCDVVVRSILGGMCENTVEREASRVIFQAARAAIDGVTAIDLLIAGAAPDGIELQELDEPLLLLGLAGVAVDAHGVGFVLNHSGGQAIILPGLGATAPELDALKPGTIKMAVVAGTAASEPPHLATRYDPMAAGDDGWNKLAELAHKTYVPASEQSRISGAGAGLTDND